MKTITYYHIGGAEKIDEHRDPVLLSFNRVDGYVSQTKPHSHPYLEAFLVLEGSGRVRTEDQTAEFTKGDMLVVSAGCIHSLEVTGETPLSFYSLLLDGLSTMQTLSLKQDASAASEYFNKLAEELSDKNGALAFAVEGFIKLICAEIVRLQPSVQHVFNSHASATAKSAKEIIDERYSDPLTLNDLAQAVFVNRFSLVHAFKRAYNTTPMQYLNYVRINRAQTLLEGSTDSVTEIARKVGFDNPVYFAEQFKKAVGTTPSVFRKINNFSIE